MLITLESTLVNRKCVRGLVVLMLTLKHNKRAKKIVSTKFIFSLIRRKVLWQQLKTASNGTDE